MNIQTFSQIYFRIPIFIRLLISVLILMFFFGLIIHFIEPSHFPTIFEGVWWAFVTGATVGYGDYVPLTIIGKVLGILLILTGGGLVTFYMATISASTVKHEQDLSKGRVSFKGKGHVVFVGWNERTRQLLKMILARSQNENIVLIDNTLKTLPYQEQHIHFIHGDATEDETLKKANLQEAKYAVITSDPSKKEREADQNCILTTVAMKGNNPKLFIITEILTREQTENARRAGADTVIRSNDFMSTLFFHELFRKDPVKPFELLLEVFSNQQFNQFLLPQDLENKTFLECADHYAKSEQLLIGIMRNGELSINPPFNSELKTGDLLIVLTPLK